MRIEVQKEIVCQISKGKTKRLHHQFDLMVKSQDNNPNSSLKKNPNNKDPEELALTATILVSLSLNNNLSQKTIFPI